MKFEYKMIQYPTVIIGGAKELEFIAASSLENLVNEQANDGWEFYRIDEFFTEQEKKLLSGGSETRTLYKVITFRREIV